MAFNAMLTALSASQARQRQLVADAGHELRTPLTSLRTNLDLLAQADSSAKLSAQSRKELLDDVRGQIAEMTTLIGDLVELAREDPSASSAGRARRAGRRGRPRRSPAYAAGRPTVQFDVRTEPWWVTGDPAALERAITNLLDNAAKWSPEGGRVTVELEQGHGHRLRPGQGHRRRTTSRTSSTASTARPSPGGCPAPAWACRS